MDALESGCVALFEGESCFDGDDISAAAEKVGVTDEVAKFTHVPEAKEVTFGLEHAVHGFKKSLVFPFLNIPQTGAEVGRQVAGHVFYTHLVVSNMPLETASIATKQNIRSLSIISNVLDGSCIL